MIYFIERFDPSDIPFENSLEACTVNNKIYDIVIGPKDFRLGEIADHVIDDYNCFGKTRARESHLIAEILKERFDLNVQNLILG